jgi:hypothetical protein
VNRTGAGERRQRLDRRVTGASAIDPAEPSSVSSHLPRCRRVLGFYPLENNVEKMAYAEDLP